MFFFFFFFFSKPVTLCFSDLFKEIDTYDKSNDLVALKSP